MTYMPSLKPLGLSCQNQGPLHHRWVSCLSQRNNAPPFIYPSHLQPSTPTFTDFSYSSSSNYHYHYPLTTTTSSHQLPIPLATDYYHNNDCCCLPTHLLTCIPAAAAAAAAIAAAISLKLERCLGAGCAIQIRLEGCCSDLVILGRCCVICRKAFRASLFSDGPKG